MLCGTVEAAVSIDIDLVRWCEVAWAGEGDRVMPGSTPESLEGLSCIKVCMQEFRLKGLIKLLGLMVPFFCLQPIPHCSLKSEEAVCIAGWCGDVAVVGAPISGAHGTSHGGW